ncbi:TPA: lipopolysaccharide biosynthesis protein [Citrobacter freundii]
MLKNKVLLGAQIGLITSVLMLISNFLLRSYFVKIYGADLTGYYLLIVQLMGLLNLAELGVGTALTYILFKPLHEGDQEGIKGLFCVIKKIYICIAVAILVIGGLFSIFLHVIVDSSIASKDLYIPWYLFVLSTSVSYFYSAQTVLLTADQNVYIVKFITGVARVLTYVIQICIIFYGAPFWMVCIIELLSNIIQYYLFDVIVKNKYEYLKKISETYEVRHKPEINKKIKKEVKYTFIHKFAGVAVFNTDYLIISVFLGVSLITSFSSYMMLIQALGFIISALASPLGAHIGSKFHKEGRDKVIALISLYNTGFFILAMICSFIFYTSSSAFVRLWMGDSVLLDRTTVFLLAMNCFVLVARTSFDAAKVGLGYMSDIELPLLEAGINIVLSIWLVQMYGLKGIVLGTLISNFLVVMFMKPVFLYRRALGLNIKLIINELFRLWFFVILFFGLAYFNYNNDMVYADNWLTYLGCVFYKNTVPVFILLLIWCGLDRFTRAFILDCLNKKLKKYNVFR